MRPRVKICGITRVEDALLAEELGADAIGMIFYPKSPRSVTPRAAAEICAALGPLTTRVGVFVNETAGRINAIAEECGLDRIQLHGDEPYAMLAGLNRPGYRAFRVREDTDLAALAAEPDRVLLLDPHHPNYGGTGQRVDWELARQAARQRPIILAGSLGPDNVVEAARTVRPHGLDASSALEAEPGRKDHGKMNAYFNALATLAGGA